MDGHPLIIARWWGTGLGLQAARWSAVGRGGSQDSPFPRFSEGRAGENIADPLAQSKVFQAMVTG